MTGQPAPVSALLFLYERTAVNRLRRQIARARSPRYIAAVVMGVLYIWWALFRNTQLGGGPLAALVKTDIAVPIASAFMRLGILILRGPDIRLTSLIPLSSPISLTRPSVVRRSWGGASCRFC